MDKNYNVDDILSEIKRRKSQEKPGGTKESHVFPNTNDSPDVGAPVDFGRPIAKPDGDKADMPKDFRFAPPEGERESHFHPKPDPTGPGKEPDDFTFTMPIDTEPETSKRQNPMNFTGHVRSIQDKAKMRPSKLNKGQRPTAQSQFDFQAVEEPPVKIVDFSSFKTPSAGQEQPQAHTRVLPKFPTGKDIDVEELQKNGIGATAADDYEDSYYDEGEDLPDNLPESSAVDFSEYNSIKDRREVATDIAKVKLWLFIRTAATAFLTFVLFWFTLSGRYEFLALPKALHPVPATMNMYLLACTILTVLVAIVNSSAVGGGLISLFKMRANSDTLAALATLAAVAQGIVLTANHETVDPTRLNLYFCVAALSMLFGAIGKMTLINRIQTNFRIVASDKKKKALLAVDSDEFCREFVPDAVYRPTIAYAVKSDFFTDFLSLSYSDKYDVGINRAVAPVCLAGAVIVGIAVFLLSSDMPSAVSALTAILCVSATLSATFIENIPLGKLTKKLAPQGGMVSGNKAVEDFCDTEALVLSENDLFPDGNVRLRGIKSFSQGRIDEAILDAASVICAMDGALSPVFLQMIGGNKKLLKKVDNIVFENSMGVSAWVDSRRVLIGNRLLMQNHSVALPPDAAKHNQITAPEDGEMLFVAHSGQVSAQFAVSYHIDNDLATQLDLLAARDKLLIIYTCDANITPHRIWELYGYPEECIQILPAERHVQYRRMSEPRENAIAEIVYTGRAATLVAAIVACINARSSILSATVVQLIQIVLGYGLVAFMAFMGAIGALTIYQLCLYQLFWFAAIFVIQKVKQP